MSNNHEPNSNDAEKDIEEKEVSTSKIKEIIKKIWSSNILQRALYLLSAIWAYAPVVGTIIFWMGIWSGPLYFTSWFLFQLIYLNLGEVGFNRVYSLYNVGFTPGVIALLVIEVLIFVIGLVLFLWGVIQIAIAIVKKKGLVTNGLYKYIRHPQLLGIIIMGFVWSLYIPGTEDWGIKVGKSFLGHSLHSYFFYGQNSRNDSWQRNLVMNSLNIVRLQARFFQGFSTDQKSEEVIMK